MSTTAAPSPTATPLRNPPGIHRQKGASEPFRASPNSWTAEAGAFIDYAQKIALETVKRVIRLVIPLFIALLGLVGLLGASLACYHSLVFAYQGVIPNSIASSLSAITIMAITAVGLSILGVFQENQEIFYEALDGLFAPFSI